MQAIILCGGLSTRLGDITKTMPKILLDIRGRMVLDWQLDFLSGAGVDEVILASGHLHDTLYKAIGESYGGMRIRYAKEEKRLGTGGAIQNAMRYVSTSPFFVLNGDILLNLPASRMVDGIQPEMDGLLLGVWVEDISTYGEIISDHRERITAFREKQPIHRSGYANGAIYLFNQSIANYFPGRDVFSIERDVFPYVQNLYVFKAEIDWIDVGVPERLAYARQHFSMPGGPKPLHRARRLQLAHEIAAQVQQHYRERVLAIGVYGSLARGTDGPYSDIEIHCVLREAPLETSHEWSTGAWKAEVDVYSEDVALRLASEVDGDWPITHGAFTQILAIYDPTGFFDHLRDTTLSQPNQVFWQAIRGVIVGELYEYVGKIRNARALRNDACLPYFAVEIAKFGACLIGLANRHLYTTTSRIFEESLALPDRPDGYDALCRMVMAGELTDALRIADATDTFWSGIEKWAKAHDIQIETELETVLKLEP